LKLKVQIKIDADGFTLKNFKNMDASLFPILFLFGWLLPFVLAISISFWLVGKGNRLLWILPFFLLWFGIGFLFIKLGSTQLSLITLITDWLVACTVIFFSYLFRRIRTAIKNKPAPIKTGT